MPRSRLKAPPKARPSIAVLIHQLQTTKLPRASLLVEARRTLAARDQTSQRDEASTAKLRAIFEQRLREAMEREGPKSSSLLACARMYEQDRAQRTPGAWTREDTLAAVARGLPEGLTLPFPAPVRAP